jgi:hypothetical protein
MMRQLDDFRVEAPHGFQAFGSAGDKLHISAGGGMDSQSKEEK